MLILVIVGLVFLTFCGGALWDYMVQRRRRKVRTEVEKTVSHSGPGGN